MVIQTHQQTSWLTLPTLGLYNSTTMKTDPVDHSDTNFDQWLLEENQQMAYQGMLDEYSDYNMFEADSEEAQQLLKPSIRPPAVKD